MTTATWSDRPRVQAPNGLAWLQLGAGPEVVLIHGVGLRSEAWARQIDGLAAAYRLTLVDLPGHGESPRVPAPTTLAPFTDAVAEALASLGRRTHVVGHSMGALVALDLAIRHPYLCRGVVALNAIYRRSTRAAAIVRARAEGLNGHDPIDPSEILTRWFANELERSEAIACRKWLTGVDPAGYREAYTVFANADGPSDADLATLGCPALFATGEHEPNSTPAMSHAMAEIAPQGRVSVIADAAHMMPMTHASQVNRLLDSFLRGDDTPSLTG